MMKQPTAPPSDGQAAPAEGIYPELPMMEESVGLAAKKVEPTEGSSYRLQEISRLKTRLENERDKRAELHKKYRRGVNALDGVDTCLFTTSMGVGVAGVGLLTTIIAAPVVLGLEIAAVACGIVGVSCKFIGRRLAVKAKKHDQVRVLAESKLNTISDHVSKALLDGKIDDGEFCLILDEVSKYDQMKAMIRARSRKSHAAVPHPVLDEETKKSLIRQGRDEACMSFVTKLSAGP